MGDFAQHGVVAAASSSPAGRTAREMSGEFGDARVHLTPLRSDGKSDTFPGIGSFEQFVSKMRFLKRFSGYFGRKKGTS